MSDHEVRKYGAQIDPASVISDELYADRQALHAVMASAMLRAEVLEGSARAGVLVDVESLRINTDTSLFDTDLTVMRATVRGVQFSPVHLGHAPVGGAS